MIHEIEPFLVSALLDRLDPALGATCTVEGCHHHIAEHDSAQQRELASAA